MDQIFTIGYEGAALADFLDTLSEAKVDVLIDAREMPLSRRKGFSKNALRAELERVGIAYTHQKTLGSPKPIRDKLRADHDYPTFFRSYGSYLKKQSGIVAELTDSIQGSVALLCYERDPHTCHRKSVAEAMGSIVGTKPIHLGVICSWAT